MLCITARTSCSTLEQSQLYYFDMFFVFLNISIFSASLWLEIPLKTVMTKSLFIVKHSVIVKSFFLHLLCISKPII